MTVILVPASPPSPAWEPALTTPYVFPPECTRVYNLASANSTYQSFAQLSETFLYVQTEQLQYQSCQPPESTDREGHEGKAYSAAVCPSGWKAWSVGLKSRFVSYSGAEMAGNEVSSTWSSAYCCESGHELVDDIWTLYANSSTASPKVCAEPITSPYLSTLPTARSSFAYFEIPGTLTTTAVSKTITSASTLTISTYTDISSTISLASGRAFHPAWSVEWEASDNPTLSPQWPLLTSDMLIPTWMPGEPVPSGIWDNKGEGVRIEPRFDLTQWVLPTVIVLGVFLGLSLGALSFSIWRLMKETRRRRAAELQGNPTDVDDGEARRVSMREGGGARVVDVRSGRRSNNTPLNGNINGNGNGNRNV